MTEIILETLTDSVKLVPFLFLTYLAMEYLEHKTGGKAGGIVKRAGKWGPLIGGVLGAAPQCGFSAAASNLYAGRVITLGTLLAIYLSTSDEMLPILISEQAGAAVIFKILAFKIVIGAFAGFLIDMVCRRRENRQAGHDPEHPQIREMCEQEHCHCENGIVRSAVRHTAQITFFILVITFLLNLILHYVGEDALAGLLLNRPVIGQAVAGIVGLIPNCAASVVITQLYLEGAMGFGAMMSGLLVGAGVGVLVLFRVNHNKLENIKITGILYITGVAAGILIELAQRGILS